MTEVFEWQSDDHEARLQQVRDIVATDFPADTESDLDVVTEFGWKKKDGRNALFNLDQILTICGPMIAGSNPADVLPTLQSAHVRAEAIKRKGEEFAERCRSIGRETLNRSE